MWEGWAPCYTRALPLHLCGKRARLWWWGCHPLRGLVLGCRDWPRAVLVSGLGTAWCTTACCSRTLVGCVWCRVSTVGTVCVRTGSARVAETGACHVARGCCWRFVSEGGGWCVRIDGVCCGSTQHRHTTTRPQQHRHTDAAPPHDPCCGQSQSTSRSRVGVGVRFQVMCSVSPFQTPRASPPAWFGVGMQC